jgi:OFA family oxalate/formate antiporter-like MFS transporter
MPPLPLRRNDAAAIIGCAALMLVGWSGLLVPSLIRSIEHDFGQSDAGIGVYFLVNAIAYATGSMVGGFLTERLGRRTVLPAAVVLIAVGLIGLATVPSWELFLVAAIPFGFGSGEIDGGTNGLILDLYPSSRGRALNLLHLFFSLGALASPLVVGRLLEAGAPWQAVVLGTALVAIPVAVLLAAVDMPSGRHGGTSEATDPDAVDPTGRARMVLALPLIALAIAIGCYVGSEVGVSNWLVRYLAAASIGLATSALALFWGCLALGRLLSAVSSDRFDHARFAAIASFVAAFALVAAVAVPSLPASILLFGVVGFAFGPIYPLIMAVAGDRFPGRSAAVSGFLSGIAVVGAVTYPPLMGFVSVGPGLGVAMAGAAVLVFGCGIALVLVRRAPPVRVDLPDPG